MKKPYEKATIELIQSCPNETIASGLLTSKPDNDGAEFDFEDM